MTTPPEPAPDSGLDQRVGALESGQSSILEKLDQLLGGNNTPAEPERPEVNIADEIRKQLGERDRRARQQPAAPAATPAPEPEQPPKAPVRKVTRAIWGDDD